MAERCHDGPPHWRPATLSSQGRLPTARTQGQLATRGPASGWQLFQSSGGRWRNAPRKSAKMMPPLKALPPRS
eukprot:15390054-Alexandrium_andersonii.AAC.1